MLLTRGTGDVSMKSPTTLAVPENKPLMWQGSVGEDLQHLEKDRAIHTDPDETRRRRTIKLDRNNNTLGFTLQTYGIKNKKTNELEVMTYVDYVEFHGPAGLAGMRKGDVILSVNGENVEGLPHRNLVKKIQDSKGSSLRLVVLFEDCCRKVELYERFIKLKQVLKMKYEELRCLEKKENCILEGHSGFSRTSSVRSSLRSSTSSDWDRFSMIVSPAQMLQSVPRTGPQHFLFPRAYPSSVDTCSELSLNDITLNDSFSDDSDAFLSTSCSDIVSIQGLKKNKMNSLSNQSVSSLVTRAEGDLSHENVSKDSKDDSSLENLKLESKDDLNHEQMSRKSKNISGHEEIVQNENEVQRNENMKNDSNNENVKRETKVEQKENCDNVESERVVFTIDGGEDDVEDDDIPADNNIQKNVEDKKLHNLIEDEKGDTSSSKRSTLTGVSMPADSSETNNSDIAVLPIGETVVTKSVVGNQEDNALPKGDYSTKGNNSTKGDNYTTPKTTKIKFVRGVRVNDFDQVTKL